MMCSWRWHGKSGEEAEMDMVSESWTSVALVAWPIRASEGGRGWVE